MGNKYFCLDCSGISEGEVCKTCGNKVWYLANDYDEDGFTKCKMCGVVHKYKVGKCGVCGFEPAKSFKAEGCMVGDNSCVCCGWRAEDGVKVSGCPRCKNSFV